jgi:hypothetical protein
MSPNHMNVVAQVLELRWCRRAGHQESGKQNGEQKDQPKIEDDEFGG